jgi:hypothetical protein
LSLQREVIQPDVLEERVVSTVIKHLSLSYIVQQLPTTEHQMSEELSLLQSVLQEVYKRLDALIRQLQVNVNVKRLDALIRQLQVNINVKRLDALIIQLQVNINVKRLDALIIRQLQVNVNVKRLDALIIRQLQVNVNVKRLDALIRQLQVNVSGIVMIEYLVISHTKESSEQLEDIQG